jgi:hypothetical protein
VDFKNKGMFFGAMAGVPFFINDLRSVCLSADLNNPIWHGGIWLNHFGNKGFSNDRLVMWTSRSLNRSISLGVSYAFKRVSIINHKEPFSVSGSVGSQISVSPDFKFGFCIELPVNLMNRDNGQLDLIFLKAGINYRLSENTNMTLDLTSNGSSSPSINCGLGYMYKNKIKIKSGYASTTGQGFLSIDFSKWNLVWAFLISFHDRLGPSTFFSISNDKL